MQLKCVVAAIPLVLTLASLAVARPFDDARASHTRDDYGAILGGSSNVAPPQFPEINIGAMHLVVNVANKPFKVADNTDAPPMPVAGTRAVKGLDPDVLALRNSLEATSHSQANTHDILTNARNRDINVKAAIIIASQRGDVRFLDAPDPKFLTEANVNALMEARAAIVQDQIAKALNTASEGKAPDAHRALVALYNTPGLTNGMKNQIRIAHLNVDEIQQSVVKQLQAKNADDAYMAYQAVFAKGEKPDRSRFPNTLEGELGFRRYSDHYYAGTYVPEKKSQANLQQALADMDGNWDKNLTDLGLTQADASSPAKVNAAIAKKYGELINQEDRTTLAAELEKRRVAGAATGRGAR